GAFAFGFLDDVIGGKNTIQITNIAFVAAVLVAVFAPTKFWFWVAGIMIGLFAGPNQAASRSLMGRFVPPDRESEFFGFYAFSGKATAFMGPLLLGLLTQVFDSQRVGISIVIVLFAIGAFILRKLDEEEGKRLSGR
ncbi:MAG: MFS transporter, partial [Calditrichaeota bacterium]|nr:MFS transporter [Calditrichota bacterium]